MVETIGLHFAVDRSEAAGRGALAATLREDRVREGHGDRKERAKPSLTTGRQTKWRPLAIINIVISIVYHEMTHRAFERIGSRRETSRESVVGVGLISVGGCPVGGRPRETFGITMIT